MDVILDSNIYIADPWLRSLRTRSLIEYLAKTRGILVLPEVVEHEVRAHVRRTFTNVASMLEASARNAERAGLSPLPVIKGDEIADQSFQKWEQTVHEALPRTVLKAVPLPSGILPEVVRRAAYRLPPVRANGKETRDTMLWLSITDYLKSRNSSAPVAFISLNTEDFASSDGLSLRPELALDLADWKGAFEYFPSVEGFLRSYAEPIGHINEAWVRERVDMNEVSALITHRLEHSISPDRWFRISSSEYRDDYEPREVVCVFEPDISLYNLYVWEVESDVVQVLLDFGVNVEADCECRLTRGGSRWREDPEDWSLNRTLTCGAELMVSVAATIRSDTLTLDDIEEITTL